MRVLFIPRILLLITFVIVSIQMAGCAPKSYRYPTYEDFKNLEDPDRIDITPNIVDLYNAMSFTQEDLELIDSHGNTEELIGAGIQAYNAFRKNPLGRALLLKAAEKEPDNPLTWAALLGQEVSIIIHEKKTEGFADMQGHIDSFERADPDNALPLFYRAVLNFYEGDIEGTESEIIKTSKKQRFMTYDADKRKAVIKAAERLGFSAFSARQYALLYIVRDVLSYPEVVGEILSNDRINVETANAMLEIGRKMELQSKLSIEMLVSLVIQSHSVERLNDADGLEFVNKKVESRTRKPRMIDGNPYGHVPEKRWVQFDDEMLESGEKEAFERLYSEYKEKFTLPTSSPPQ